MPVQTLAFDVYGTLFDTSGVIDLVRSLVGDIADRFVGTWRSKQLEYSFRRGLMKRYVDFSVCTSQALEFTCQQLGVQLTSKESDTLIEAYKKLPLFPDVMPCLEDLSRTGYRIYAFSNGSAKAVTGLVQTANALPYFTGIVSVEAIQMFKPHPDVYRHFNWETSSEKNSSWLISGNAFDVLGAASYGMNTVYVKRTPEHVLDPWEIQPTHIIHSLIELPAILT